VTNKDEEVKIDLSKNKRIFKIFLDKETFYV